ncbi:hypothetical protein G9A89_020237 [Geosiphon pyriformis]|nr:hypothetical protein G9A89_020237 [Geosiphon pyriformis]
MPDTKRLLQKYAWYANLAYSLKDSLYVSSVIGDPDELIIYFRGNLLLPSEWISAFHGKMVEYPLYAKAKVNKYFWDQFRRVNFDISSIFEEMKLIEEIKGLDTIYRLTFVGHGMGAVYATFAAYEFYQSTKTSHIPIRLFTYGQPRIGNLQFARALNEAVFAKARVNYKNDIVVNLPHDGSTSQNEDYFHSIMEYWIELDNCDCNNNDQFLENTIVYQCHGGEKYYPDGYFLDESEECAHAKKPFQFLLNNGPYFGITMGVSPAKQPWKK